MANKGTSPTVGIVGAGLMGRLLALALRQDGWAVDLFDQDAKAGTRSCTYVGAGMLSPMAELESAEPLISQLGLKSLSLWQGWLSRLAQPVFFQQAGTLVVAHHQDRPELERLRQQLQRKLETGFPSALDQGHANPWQLTGEDIAALEPALSGRFHEGMFLAGEAQLDNRQLLGALAASLEQAGVCWYPETHITKVIANQIGDRMYDWVIDCRGLGAKADWQNLRGVRGELIRVHAPDVVLSRPVRLMHPRYSLYIVPRENHHYVIGATSIESDDLKPMTLQSALELMSATYTVHPAFGEATILELQAQCRPTLPDHLPKIQVSPGLIRINGLYRHGFLVAPALVDLVCQYLQTQSILGEEAAVLFEETKEGVIYAPCA